ncbi:arylsulfatase, partial [bacterium]|nr:arylsulfatase [bacterium]
RGGLRRTPCHFVDLLPTLLELAGTRASTTWKGRPVPPLAGRSLAPALGKDVTLERDFLYFHHSGNRAIRVGDWKLAAAGRRGPWELYNLRTDRCECRNVASQHPEKVRQLAAEWQRRETAFRRMAAQDEWRGP